MDGVADGPTPAPIRQGAAKVVTKEATVSIKSVSETQSDSVFNSHSAAKRVSAILSNGNGDSLDAQSSKRKKKKKGPKKPKRANQDSLQEGVQEGVPIAKQEFASSKDIATTGSNKGPPYSKVGRGRRRSKLTDETDSANDGENGDNHASKARARRMAVGEQKNRDDAIDACPQPQDKKNPQPTPKPRGRDTPQQQQPKKLPARERSPIRPPSAESGGVPEPTAEYMEQSARTSVLLPPGAGPQPLLVVIDLNGTLLHRPNRRAPSRFVMRPHAAKFLAYCIKTFWVVVWSSARPANVESMCRQLLAPHQLHQLVAIWGRDRFGLTPDDYNNRVQCYKRLSTLWNDPVVARSYPQSAAAATAAAGTGHWSQANTILIDDSLEKARSEPFNLIAIPEFLGDVADSPDVLPQVHDYLNSMCAQSDVSAYLRQNPFRASDSL